MWLKGCPRCQGDLFEEATVVPELYGGHLVTCLQCGYVLTEEQEARLSRHTQARPAAGQRRLNSTPLSA